MNALPLNARSRKRIERLGDEFLAALLSAETRRKPGNAEALGELAQVLVRLGRVEDGLRIDLQLVRMAPENPVVHYNLACSLTQLERLDEALDALERAVGLGYDDVQHLLSDEDLTALHGETRFDELVRRLSSAR